MPDMDLRNAQAAVVREPGGQFIIENVKLEAPRRDEVLVKVVATGICATDLGVQAGHFPTPLPVVLGHEGSGIVEAVGEDVHDLAIGDHVVMSISSCGHCPMCMAGKPAYCQLAMPLNFLGQRADGSNATIDAHGHKVHDHFFGQSSFGTLALANRRSVVKVAKDAPLELLGPLGCGIQTGAGAVLNSLQVQAGSTIAVFGAGTVGLSAVMAARVAGAVTIIAVDVTQSRLDLALELGATHIVNSAKTDPVAAIREITGGGVNYSLDCAGRADVLSKAYSSLAVKGHCGLVGAAPPGTMASFEMQELVITGRSITGIVEGDSNPPLFIPKLIALYQQGRFPFDKLVKFYDFDKINEAAVDAAKGVTIKPIVRLAR